ncbi:amidase domain-containing protein [Humibacter ginsengisoli]
MSYPPNESHTRIRSRIPRASGRRVRGVRAAVLAVAAASALVLAGCTAHTARTADATRAAEHTAASSPSVMAVSPAQASVVGQKVTITGTDLQNVKAVAFGSASVRVLSASADKVVAQAPAAANYQPATVGLKLIGKTGKTIATKPGALEYTAAGGVAAQLEYALAHWQNYNTAEYGDLNPDGGDCANFVSQTLIARGWTMNDDWYNHEAGDDWSPAWGYVPAMDDYFAENAASLGLEQLSFSQADRAKVALGDIAVFDWDGDGSPDHVEVVDRITKVNGQYKIELASHNDDYAYRDLDETITTQHPGATGHFWHLTR